MIRMADKYHPLRKFHKQQTKPRRTAFNVIQFVCRECGWRMFGSKTEGQVSSFKCSNPECGRTSKRGRGEDNGVPI
jgi:hypothetical protein